MKGKMSVIRSVLVILLGIAISIHAEAQVEVIAVPDSMQADTAQWQINRVGEYSNLEDTASERWMFWAELMLYDLKSDRKEKAETAAVAPNPTSVQDGMVSVQHIPDSLQQIARQICYRAICYEILPKPEHLDNIYRGSTYCELFGETFLLQNPEESMNLFRIPVERISFQSAPTEWYTFLSLLPENKAVAIDGMTEPPQICLLYKQDKELYIIRCPIFMEMGKALSLFRYFLGGINRESPNMTFME
ncbi:hypothetical protein [uncultured Bacteroides sp.]|uniref:hypothetical protein n=1 Tax=uncultured Bacteroides sp. TaxID=162156 RepID=UPI002612EA25|nr:hypothetical protein [uncultured Bacteroides sp.]